MPLLAIPSVHIDLRATQSGWYAGITLQFDCGETARFGTALEPTEEAALEEAKRRALLLIRGRGFTAPAGAIAWSVSREGRPPAERALAS